MELDIYQPCPVHPEKKIKFCCGKEVAGELNQIFAKFEARQPAAALESLNRLIDKAGPRDCLLSLKVQLLASLGSFEQAGEVNEQFLAANPNHSVGMEQRAVMMAHQGRTQEAFDALQTAMDNLPGAQIPVGFAMAFLAVGTNLFKAGLLWPARAHLAFAQALKPEDESIAQTLEYMLMAADSLVLKRTLAPLPAPAEETPWRKRFENAGKAARRGQFRKAVELARKALEMEPTSSLLIQNLAILQSNLPDRQALLDAWNKVAACTELPLIDRVEAAAIVQTFTAPGEADFRPVQQVVFEFDRDFDDVHGLALSSKRLVLDEVDPEHDEADGPPPRAAFLFLDSDRLDKTEGIHPDDVPQVVGQVLLYGKQTDRRARWELVLKQTETFEEDLREFQAIFAGALQQTAVNQIGEYSVTNHRLQSAWHLPPTTPRSEYQRLEREQQLKIAAEILPAIPLGYLKGQSLRDIVRTPGGELQARAVIERLALTMDGQPWQMEFRVAAHRALGLEPMGHFSFSSVEEITSPFRAVFANQETLPPSQLEVMFVIAANLGNISMIREVGQRLLQRGEFSERLTRDMLLASLAQSESDDERCLEYLADAKKTALAGNRPIGKLLVLEFEQRLLRGKVNGLRNLLMELQKNHLRDREVAERLSFVLAKYGLITPDGRVFLPPEQETTPKSGLWTPDADGGNAATETGGSGSSKLWVPGQ